MQRSTVSVLVASIAFLLLAGTPSAWGQMALLRSRREVDLETQPEDDVGGKLDDLPYCKENAARDALDGCRIHSHVSLLPGYDINEMPKVDDGRSAPLVVNFSINLNNILAIDEPNQVKGA